MHSNISLRLCSKILQGQIIYLVSLILPSPEVDHCIAFPDGFNAVFKLRDPRLSKNPVLASLRPPLSISETSSALLTEHRISSIPSIPHSRPTFQTWLHNFSINITNPSPPKLHPPSLNQESA
ncbi:hypothetical protein CHARACLAT_030915 [Characodon lateralis]|uniref:Uncharacterized protein n=1 Tax=Characodon lateralis TaxID=208331 RepID=A0ABU7EFP0_9TELE|nr:hypothetical protein [Characodon lateralis]